MHILAMSMETARGWGSVISKLSDAAQQVVTINTEMKLE